MKKEILLPSLCFAVLSTPAFEEVIHAAEHGTPLSEAENKITAVYKYVSVDDGAKLNMREGASTTAKVVQTLANGTKVAVLSENNGWAKIQANGKEGYVSTAFLSDSKPEETPLETHAADLEEQMAKQEADSGNKEPDDNNDGPKVIKYVNVNSGSVLHMRQDASTNSTIVSNLANGTAVSILSEENGWAKISVDEKTGFVDASYLSDSKPEIDNKENAETNSLSASKKADSPDSRKANSVSSKTRQSTSESDDESSNAVRVQSNSSNTVFTATTFSANAQTTLAETGKTMYVNVSSGSNLNMRANPSTSAAIIGKLAKDTAVTVLAEENGWAKIQANGKTGYVSSQYLSNSKSGNTGSSNNKPAAKTMYVNVNSGSNLNMRANPSTSAAIIGKLAKDTAVTVLAEENGWAKIQANGKTGYVSSQYLANSKSSAADGNSEQKTTTKYVNVTPGSSLNLRSGPSTNSAVLDKLLRGTAVTVFSETNGWAKVEVNGKYGYVSSQYLSTDNPNKQNSSDENKAVVKYVNVNPGSSLNMRTKPSLNSSIITKLARGVEVNVLSESNGWAKIEVYGKEGYVSTEFLSPVKPGTSEGENNQTIPDDKDSDNSSGDDDKGTGEETLKYVNVNPGSSLNLRSGPDTSAPIITKLPRNTVVKVISEENGWAKVSVNNYTGYVSSQYLLDVPEKIIDESSGNITTIVQQYEITLDEMVQAQMKVNPQTDKKYATYIREDALILNNRSNPTMGTVKGSTWNIRGGAGTEHWVVGQVNGGTTLKILSQTRGSDGYIWYQVEYKKTWVNASPEDTKYYLDPNNFINDPIQSFQFLKLSTSTNLDPFEVNEKILAGKGVLAGHAATFIAASKKYGINEIYLISHALLETGNGTSKLARGVQIYGKTVYNFFGIGAYDGNAVQTGAEYAYKAGWFTPEAAIMGGAEFIAKGYISKGQDTLYKMRWNPDSVAANGYASHQYATDIGWAAKQVSHISSLYSSLTHYQILFEIPKYRN